MKYLTPTDRYDIEDFNNNFREIEDRINELEDSYPSLKTPKEVYEETRPSDWLPMPMPNDDEMYLLFHIPDGLSGLISFTVTCTGNYTVETGTVINGAFVSQTSADFASGTKYEAELFADDYGDLTSDGFKQVMIKVSGTGIKKWVPSTHSMKTIPASFSSWNIVEIACRLLNGTSVKCNSSGAIFGGLSRLSYFAWYGTNLMTDMSNMFFGCVSLVCVLSLYTNKTTNVANMFYSCSSLISIPLLNTTSCTNFVNMFCNCSSIESIPPFDVTRATNLASAFAGCSSLKSVFGWKSSRAQSTASLFSGCSSLREIPPIYIGYSTDMSRMFYNCYSLKKIPKLNCNNVTNMSYMCYNCYSLNEFPTDVPSRVTNISYMFYGCRFLKKGPSLSSGATNWNYLFYGCLSLTAIPSKLVMNKATSMSNSFYDCPCLSSIRLLPTVGGWAGISISLANCSLSHQAIIDFFHSLPRITSSKAITLTGNPGVLDLTDTDKAIATQKGWTLTL